MNQDEVKAVWRANVELGDGRLVKSDLLRTKKQQEPKMQGIPAKSGRRLLSHLHK